MSFKHVYRILATVGGFRTLGVFLFAGSGRRGGGWCLQRADVGTALET